MNGRLLILVWLWILTVAAFICVPGWKCSVSAGTATHSMRGTYDLGPHPILNPPPSPMKVVIEAATDDIPRGSGSSYRVHADWPMVGPRILIATMGYALERVLIVDDSPEKVARHYGNHVRVTPFTGDPADAELRDLTPYLRELRDVPQRPHHRKAQLATCQPRERSNLTPAGVTTSGGHVLRAIAQASPYFTTST